MAFSNDHNLIGSLEGQGENGFPLASSLVTEQNLSAVEPPQVEPLCPGEPQDMMLPVTTQEPMPVNSQQIGHHIDTTSQNVMGQVFSGPGDTGGGGGGIGLDQLGQYPNAGMSQALPGSQLLCNCGNPMLVSQNQNGNMYYHCQQRSCQEKQLHNQQLHVLRQQAQLQHWQHQLFNQHQQHRAWPLQHQNLSFHQGGQSQSQKQSCHTRQQGQNQQTARGFRSRSKAKQKKTCVASQNASLNRNCLQPQRQGSYWLTRGGQTFSGSGVPNQCFPAHSSYMAPSLPYSAVTACQPAQDPSYSRDPEIPSHNQQSLSATSVSVPTTSTAPLTFTAPNRSGMVGQFPSTVSPTKYCQGVLTPSFPGDPEIPSHSQQSLSTASVSIPTTSTAPLTSTAPNRSEMVGQFPITVSPTKYCQGVLAPSFPEDPEIPSHSQQSLSTASVSIPTTSTASLTSTAPNHSVTEGQFPSTVSLTKACQPAQDTSYLGDPEIPSHSQQSLSATSVSVPTTSTAPLTFTAPNHSGMVGQFPITVSPIKYCQGVLAPSFPEDPEIPSHSQQSLSTASVSIPTSSTASLTSTAPNHSGTEGQFPSTVSLTKACQPAQDPSYLEDPEIPSHSQQSLSATSVSIPTTSTASLTSTVPNLSGTEGQFPSTAAMKTTVSKAEENQFQAMSYSRVSQANYKSSETFDGCFSSMDSPFRPQSYGASFSGDMGLLRHPDLLPDLMPQLKAPPSQQCSFVQSSPEREHEQRKRAPVEYQVEKPECSTSDRKSDCPTSQSEVAAGAPPEVGFPTRRVGGTSPTSPPQPEMPANAALNEDMDMVMVMDMVVDMVMDMEMDMLGETLENTRYNSNEIIEELVKTGDSITDNCQEKANPAPCPSPSGVPTNHPFTREQTMFIISQVDQHITSKGRGRPKNLTDLNERLKCTRGSKKQFWMDIAEKLHTKFNQVFHHEKVNRKWSTLVEGFKKLKGNNKSTRFQFYDEMKALMDPQIEVDPVRTSEVQQVCKPEVLAHCSRVTPFAETARSQATPTQLAVKRMPKPPDTPVSPCKQKKWENGEKPFWQELNEDWQQILRNTMKQQTEILCDTMKQQTEILRDTMKQQTEILCDTMKQQTEILRGTMKQQTILCDTMKLQTEILHQIAMKLK